MATAQYSVTIGEGRRFTQTITHNPTPANPATAVPVDPPSIGFNYRSPDGTVTRLSVVDGVTFVRDAVGTYHVDLTFTQTGIWDIYGFSAPGGGYLGTGAKAQVRVDDALAR